MSKQLKILIIGSVLVVGLGVLLFFAQPSGQPADSSNSPQNLLEVSEPFYDFGTISMKDGLVSKVFKIKNTQTEAVRLAKLYTSCMCTKATLKINGRAEGPFGMPGHGSVPTFSQTIEPNAEAEIEVVFDPNAHGPSGVGPIERQVILEGPQGKVATMEIKADVTP